jgi:hypothetical protein
VGREKGSRKGAKALSDPRVVANGRDSRAKGERGRAHGFSSADTVASPASGCRSRRLWDGRKKRRGGALLELGCRAHSSSGLMRREYDRREEIGLLPLGRPVESQFASTYSPTMISLGRAQRSCYNEMQREVDPPSRCRIHGLVALATGLERAGNSGCGYRRRTDP